jgi:hypothetical protein
MIIGIYLLFGFFLSIITQKKFGAYATVEMIKNKKLPTKEKIMEAKLLYIGITTIMWGVFLTTGFIKYILGYKNV